MNVRFVACSVGTTVYTIFITRMAVLQHQHLYRRFQIDAGCSWARSTVNTSLLILFHVLCFGQ